MKDRIILNLILWRNKIRGCGKTQSYVKNVGPVPATIKREIVKCCGQKHHCNVLIETGTYLGEMIEYQADYFDKVYSVEISDLFYRFSSDRLKKRKNISIIHGDSSKVLAQIIEKLDLTDRILFWLDGHYSGGRTGMGGVVCPIYEELACIFNMRDGRDLILIDDARLFNGMEGYPDLEELKHFIRKNNENAQITVEEDIIRIQ